MSRRLILIALLLAMGPSRVLPLRQEPQGVIEGVVVHPSTKAGIPNALVSLKPPSGLSKTALTDSNGRFVIRALSPGQYDLTVRRNGYVRPNQGGGPTSVRISAETTTVELRLVASAAIAGRIVENQKPVQGVYVQALQVTYRDGERILTTAGPGPPNGAETNDRGEYRIAALTPGNYYMRVRTVRQLPGRAYRPTYYPGVASAETAVPISLKDGTDVGGIQFEILPQPASTIITGRIINPLPDASRNPVNLYLVPHNNKGGTEGNGLPEPVTNTAADRSNGQFEIRALTTGSYDLLAATRSEGIWYSGKTPVEVKDAKDIRDITVTVSLGTVVNGRVLVNGKPPQTDGLRVRVQPLKNVYLITPAPVAPDGSFTLLHLAEGRYRVFVGGLDDTMVVTDIRYDKESIYARPEAPGTMLVTSDPSPLEVSVATTAATIRGTVRGQFQQQAADATVALVPTGPSRQPNPSLYRTATTDREGKFLLHGVAPGEYKLFAWASIPPGAYENAEFLSAYQTSGKTFTITAGGQVTVDPPLILER